MQVLYIVDFWDSFAPDFEMLKVKINSYAPTIYIYINSFKTNLVTWMSCFEKSIKGCKAKLIMNLN